jgi:hypothetical protein
MRWEPHTRTPHYLHAVRVRLATPAAQSWPAGLALAAILAAMVVILDASQPLRLVVVLLFLVFVPGLSLVGLLGIADLTQRVVLSIGVSLALATIVAGLSLYADRWSPVGVLLVLVALTLAGAGLQSRMLAKAADAMPLGQSAPDAETCQADTAVAPPAVAIVASAAKTTIAGADHAPALVGGAKLNIDTRDRSGPGGPWSSGRLTRIVVVMGFMGAVIMLIVRSARRALQG